MYLNHALQQTRYKGPDMCKENWKNKLHQTIQQRNRETIVSDAEPFWENSADLQMFAKEHMLKLLKFRIEKTLEWTGNRRV